MKTEYELINSSSQSGKIKIIGSGFITCLSIKIGASVHFLQDDDLAELVETLTVLMKGKKAA